MHVENKYLSITCAVTVYNYRLLIRWESFPDWTIFNKDRECIVREIGEETREGIRNIVFVTGGRAAIVGVVIVFNRPGLGSLL